MITFSPEFQIFLRLAGAETVAESLPFDHEGVILRVAGHTWTIHKFAGRHSVARDDEQPVARDADLGSIEKILAMEFGPAVRRGVGLPPEGFLPDPFTLAPGVAHVSNGAGMSLNWREKGVLCSVATDNGQDLETLHTYRSQYLRHPLRDILSSYVEARPGIFTDQAPGVMRPFQLPERSHEWISARWPSRRLARQCVFYDSQSDGGIRISVVNGGFRVDSRDERSSRYAGFEIWAASLEVLQVYLAWEVRSARRSSIRPERHIMVPGGMDAGGLASGSQRLAAGFTIEPIEPNSVDNRPVKLLRDGIVQAVLLSSYVEGDWRDVILLSHLINIGVDLLELSILDPDGAPALEPLRPPARG